MTAEACGYEFVFGESTLFRRRPDVELAIESGVEKAGAASAVSTSFEVSRHTV